MTALKNIKDAISAFAKKQFEREFRLKPLILLVAAVIGFMFSVLALVSQYTDEISKKQQTQVFNTLLENHINITHDLVESILSLPGSMDLLYDKISISEMNSKVIQRFADKISSTDVLVTNPNGNILFGGSSYASIYPLDLVGVKPLIKDILLRMDQSPNLSFISDRIAIADDVFQLSARRLVNDDQERFLFIATPLSNVFEKSQLLPMKIDLMVGKKPPKTTKTVFVGSLKNFKGETLGWLSWSRKLPGHASITHIIPALIIATTFLILIAFFVWLQMRSVMQKMSREHQVVKNQSLQDPLTGLANRTLLKQQLEIAQSNILRGKDGFALHLIDLDKFKDVNDSLGHPAGDELIKQAAERLKEACRASDTVARIGGDEFAIIQIDSVTSSSSARLARRINEQMSRVFKLGNSETYVSASIGIVIDSSATLDQEELMRRADISLYRAKAAGRNQFCFFEEEMDTELRAKHEIEKELRSALLDPKANGLKVVYQPQVSANGRHIRGMEALIRWQHPVRGNISPAEFIPIAEETNLISTLDHFVLCEAFQTAIKWPDVTMAVNVSAKELHQEEYPGRVIALAMEYNVRPDQIELEITETVLLEDSPRVGKTLKLLKAAGFKIALDDFGTGYSSLAYLRRHQVDKLKIDQSFVASIGVREDASAVVQAILSLGAALGLTVTAEGVETIEQRDSLRSQGCAYLQGFLFSKPIEQADIEPLMKKYADRIKEQRLRQAS